MDEEILEEQCDCGEDCSRTSWCECACGDNCKCECEGEQEDL